MWFLTANLDLSVAGAVAGVLCSAIAVVFRRLTAVEDARNADKDKSIEALQKVSLALYELKEEVRRVLDKKEDK